MWRNDAVKCGLAQACLCVARSLAVTLTSISSDDLDDVLTHMSIMNVARSTALRV